MELLEFFDKTASTVQTFGYSIGALLLVFGMIAGPIIVRTLLTSRKGKTQIEETAEEIFSSLEASSYSYGSSDKIDYDSIRQLAIARKPFDYRWIVMPNRSLEIRKILQKTDKEFYPIPMMNMAKDLFARLQDCWEEGNTALVAEDLHPEYLAKLNEMIEQNYNPMIKLHIDDVTFHNFYLTFYKQDKENVYVTIYLESQMIRYAEEKATGDIVSGSNTVREESVNLMKFVRPVDGTTSTSKWLLYDFTLCVIGARDEKIVIEE